MLRRTHEGLDAAPQSEKQTQEHWHVMLRWWSWTSGSRRCPSRNSSGIRCDGRHAICDCPLPEVATCILHVQSSIPAAAAAVDPARKSQRTR